MQERQTALTELEVCHHRPHRGERPHGCLNQARQRLQAAERRYRSREQAVLEAERRLTRTEGQWQACHGEWGRLQERLARLEHDNETNPAPIEAEFRLDAGFGTYENVVERSGRGSAPMPR